MLAFVMWMVSSPYHRVDFMTASYTCIFHGSLQFVLFHNVLSLCHTEFALASLDEISCFTSASVERSVPRYVASSEAVTVCPFWNLIL